MHLSSHSFPAESKVELRKSFMTWPICAAGKRFLCKVSKPFWFISLIVLSGSPTSDVGILFISLRYSLSFFANICFRCSAI